MALRDTWHRTLVYFGLAEDRYDDEEDYDRPTPAPAAGSPEDSRPHFRRLAELAREHGLRHLSMGTSQDFPVAVEEGATIVRVGSRLYHRGD